MQNDRARLLGQLQLPLQLLPQMQQDNCRLLSPAFSIRNTTWLRQTMGHWGNTLCHRSKNIDLSQQCTLERCNQTQLQHTGNLSHKCLKGCMLHIPIYRHNSERCRCIWLVNALSTQQQRITLVITEGMMVVRMMLI
ncbi:hypothetical protein VTN02DRAFT_4385 [Thermoascus thermophilus]